MSGLPWFRLYRELKDDPKMGALDDSTFRVFVESMCWACEKGEKGRMGLTEENASWAFRRNVTQSLQLLLQLKLLGKTSSGELIVTKWEKRQRASDFSADRVRRHRAKTVTLQTPLLKQKCNGTEESRVEEIRKDTEEYSEVETAFRKSGKSPLSETYTPESRVILHELNELTGRRFRETSESLSPINARMREPDVTLDGVRKMIARQAKMWKGTHLEEYLRPSTLFGKEKFNEYYAARESEIRSEVTRGNTAPNPRNAGVATDGSDYGQLVALKIQRDNAKRNGPMETKLAGQTPELGITPP